MPKTDSFYVQVVQVTQVYLGPAADRFVARQVENHLEKDPLALTPQDLLSILDWMQVAVSMLTDDTDIVEEYIGQLQKLITAAGRQA